MTHGEESSEKTLDDGREWIKAYVWRGSHQALPVMEEEVTIPAGPGNIESKQRGGASEKAAQVGSADRMSKNVRHEKEDG